MGSSFWNDTYADDLTFYLRYRYYVQNTNTNNVNILLKKVNSGKTQFIIFGGKYK